MSFFRKISILLGKFNNYNALQSAVAVFLVILGIWTSYPFSLNDLFPVAEFTETQAQPQSTSPSNENNTSVFESTFSYSTSSELSSVYKQSSAASREYSPVPDVNATVDTSHLVTRSVLLSVSFLAQEPELPTGCEITALTTVLNYYGFGVDKLTMADTYLEKQAGPANFWEVFVGDPKTSGGFGCYATPIVNAANKYFAENAAEYAAYDISGTTFEELLTYVQNRTPVIIWGTMKMSKPSYTVSWNINGKHISWIAPEHCLVLVGYDADRGVAIMSDPQVSITEYPLNKVKERYIQLYSQAVIVKSNLSQ